MRIQVNASSKQILFGQIAMLFLNPNNLSCPNPVNPKSD